MLKIEAKNDLPFEPVFETSVGVGVGVTGAVGVGVGVPIVLPFWSTHTVTGTLTVLQTVDAP